MKKILTMCCVVLLAACSTNNRYYYEKSNLNSVSIGMSKSSLLAMFPGGDASNGAPGMMIRAAKQGQGKVIEVGEVILTDGVHSNLPYWFLLENGRLMQWGEPNDWTQVSKRYEISYTPSVSY